MRKYTKPTKYGGKDVKLNFKLLIKSRMNKQGIGVQKSSI